MRQLLPAPPGHMRQLLPAPPTRSVESELCRTKMLSRNPLPGILENNFRIFK